MRSGIFLLLGTNLGEKHSNLAAAVSRLTAQVGSVTSKSSIYETGAWGKTDQPSFYNQVVMIETLLDPLALLETILTLNKISVAYAMKNGGHGSSILIFFFTIS